MVARTRAGRARRLWRWFPRTPYERWSLLFGALTFVVVSAYTYIARKQWKSMESIASERAWVLLVSDSIRALPTCQHYRYCLGSLTFTWKNYGKGPAFDVEELDSYRPESWTLEPRQGGEPAASRFTLPPGETRPAALEFGHSFVDRTTAKALKHGGLQVLAYMTYRDKFGRSRHTRVGMHVERRSDRTMRVSVEPLNNYAD